jgi:hypothetical protein
MTFLQQDRVNPFIVHTEAVVAAGTTVTVRKHPELDELSEHDQEKLTEVIVEYNNWYDRNNHESRRNRPSMASWARAFFTIKDILLFDAIDIIRLSELKQPGVIPWEPVWLMDILNKLETCTRRVIQNTSIQRLHKKSWVHADLLSDHADLLADHTHIPGLPHTPGG